MHIQELIAGEERMAEMTKSKKEWLVEEAEVGLQAVVVVLVKSWHRPLQQVSKLKRGFNATNRLSRVPLLARTVHGSRRYSRGLRRSVCSLLHG
jgi:poly-beta-hydroxyalkanoate depolymerase